MIHDDSPAMKRSLLPRGISPVPGAALLEFGVCRASGGPFVSGTLSAKRFYVKGFVQGVGYRNFAQRAAERLDLAGYARNLPDGRVMVYAIGTLSALEAFQRALESGPSGAAVDGVAQEEASIVERFAHRFSIEYGA